MNMFERFQRIAYAAKSDKRYKYYDILKKNMLLSRSAMKRLQDSLTRKLVTHAYDSTEYYKELMEKEGIKPKDIKQASDLRHFPELNKSVIHNNLKYIKSKDHHSQDLVTVTSGGSTGFQAVICKSLYFELYSRACFLRNNSLIGWNPGDKCVWIWGAPYEHANMHQNAIARAGVLINRRLIFNAYNYSPKDFPKWVESIRSFRPKVVYGYATILLEFAKYLTEKGIVFPSVKAVVSTAEELQHREIIQQGFCRRVYNQYGCREILAIAIEGEEPGVMRVADDFVALHINANDEIIITALHSYGFPLINYKLGDCGKTEEVEEMAATEPFSALRLTIGRSTDNFITHEGRKVASSALGVYISTFQLSVNEQQIIQNSCTEFVINIVPGSAFSKTMYEEVIYKVFREYFGYEVRIQFNIMTRIPVSASGKKLMAKRMFDIE